MLRADFYIRFCNSVGVFILVRRKVMMRKLFALSVLSLSVILFATGDASAGTPEITIKLGHVVQEGVPLDLWAHRFGEIVKEKSNGTMIVEVYPAASMGGNRELCEQLQLGSIEAVITSVAFVGGFSKSTMVLDLPYLFKNNKSAEAVLDGEVGDWIFAELRKQGFVGLAWGCQGWRHLTANREIRNPEDMKGVKIRVMENPIHIAHFNTLGGSAIPMAFSEVFTALQQGAIDAQENPWCNIDANRFYEVQKYIVKTGHIYDACPLMYSEMLWDKLTPEQRKIITDAAMESVRYERDICYQDELDMENKIAATGKNVIIDLSPETRQKFFEAAAPVYQQFRSQIGGDLIDKVIAIQENLQ